VRVKPPPRSPGFLTVVAAVAFAAACSSSSSAPAGRDHAKDAPTTQGPTITRTAARGPIFVARAPLQATTPPGWHVDRGGLYVDSGDGRSFLSLANYPIRPDPSPACARLPVSALNDLPASGGLVSMQDAHDGAAYVNPRPAAEIFLPPEDEPENSHLRCLSRPGDFLFKTTGFTENGRMVQVYVALGQAAGNAVKRHIVEILTSLVVT
jgi:hypothetical protein